MTAPALLIAEREFRAYTMTASFWIALAIGPLFLAGALGLAALASSPAAPTPVAIRSSDPVLAGDASAALAEAAGIEARRFAVRRGAADNLTITTSANGRIEAHFSAGFPLSAAGKALVARTVERDLAFSRLAAQGGAVAPSPVVELADAASPPGSNASVLSRFGLVMMLWLTLTGSLGMLLQAVVRERGNRALEGLLAAARPWEIVVGKLAGVGAVSALVLVAWLGSAGLAGMFVPGGPRFFQAVAEGGSPPIMLLRAAVLYVLAFGFYGFVTVAVGATARDSASAQNLSRPMFAVLLAVFFAALAAASGAASKLAWLAYVPPFTPFMLLLEPPDALSWPEQLLAVVLTLAATAVAGRLAVGRLTLSGRPERGRAQA
jgi:ABC-2 type transport system permease protein